jgi:hypothetical protein
LIAGGLQAWRKPAQNGPAKNPMLFLVNIARLHFRDQRGRPVSEQSALGGTDNPHAVKASAIDSECCRLREPDHGGDDGAEGGTAHDG